MIGKSKTQESTDAEIKNSSQETKLHILKLYELI